MPTHPRSIRLPASALLLALGGVVCATGLSCRAAQSGRAADGSPASTTVGPVSAADPSASSAGRAALGRFETVRIDGVPHVLQKPDFCGEAVTEMALRKLGKFFDQDDVFALSGMDPARGMGATTRELEHALVKLGFRVGPVWHEAPATEAPQALANQFADLHADLKRGVPSIVCMHYDDQPNTTEHFRLVLGYDAGTDEIVYHEPAEAAGAYLRMKRQHFMKLWPLKYDPQRWLIIRLKLEPGELLQKPPPRPKHSPADLAQHVRELRRSLPHGFTVVVEPPFVVIGDEPPAAVRKRAERTVRWAVTRLKKEYFTKDPNHILDIWLFKDKRSYQAGAMRISGTAPGTPYGYYSDARKALVMNIATGGGTLVHEIVHPFVESNFPDCPAWFNEALGSLYEQSSSRNDRIIGLTNWRLAGLQQAIRAGQVPSFKTLTSTTTYEFYEEDPGTNYAQARYLAYYLQEKGLLRGYYQRFHANVARDPTGYESLKQVLGESDMHAFKKRWEAYVLGLKFP